MRTFLYVISRMLSRAGMVLAHAGDAVHNIGGALEEYSDRRI